MSDPDSSRSGEPDQADENIIGEVQAFDPGPSVAAAAAALDRQGAGFALIGGLALEAWGIPRATKDADFAVPVGVAEAAALRIDLVDRRFHFARVLARDEPCVGGAQRRH